MLLKVPAALLTSLPGSPWGMLWVEANQRIFCCCEEYSGIFVFTKGLLKEVNLIIDVPEYLRTLWIAAKYFGILMIKCDLPGYYPAPPLLL